MNTPENKTWRPSPAIWASVGIHGAAGVAVAVQPALWPLSLGAVAANHIGLTAIGLWPRSTWLGPNVLHLNTAAIHAKQVAITFDDGPNPNVTPWVLDQLDQHQAKATFFCVGETVRQHKDIAQEIVRRGHNIENHSDQHSNAFSAFGIGRLGRDIDAAQHTIAEVTGRLPQLFRAPAGLRSPLLEPVLAKRGLTLTSWTRRGFDTVEKDAAKVLTRLTNDLAAGDILLLHDGNQMHAKKNVIAKSKYTAAIFAVLPKLLAQFSALDLSAVKIEHSNIRSVE
jgi:peptidoglycan-N-acetylglucosamine deacetylase